MRKSYFETNFIKKLKAIEDSSKMNSVRYSNNSIMAQPMSTNIQTNCKTYQKPVQKNINYHELETLKKLSEMDLIKTVKFIMKLVNCKKVKFDSIAEVSKFFKALANLDPYNLEFFLKRSGFLTAEMIQRMLKLLSNSNLDLTDAETSYLSNALRKSPIELMDYLITNEIKLRPTALAYLIDAFEHEGGMESFLMSGKTLLEYLPSIVDKDFKRILAKALNNAKPIYGNNSFGFNGRCFRYLKETPLQFPLTGDCNARFYRSAQYQQPQLSQQLHQSSFTQGEYCICTPCCKQNVKHKGRRK